MFKLGQLMTFTVALIGAVSVAEDTETWMKMDLSNIQQVEEDEKFFPAGTESRKLEKLYGSSRSSGCKRCIDDSNFFCQNIAGTAGNCCSSSTDCDAVDICSFYAPQSSISLKYWSCPSNLNTCGVEPLIVTDSTGATRNLAPAQGNADFLSDAMCRYRLVFPQDGSEFDQIYVKLTSTTQSIVYHTETSTYKSLKYDEKQMVIGEQYATTWPNEIFLLALADESGTPASFNVEYYYVYRNRDEVIDNMSVEERDKYYNRTRKTTDESIETTWTFWVFVAAGVVGAALIIALIVVLVRLKNRNDKIVAKVETLSQDQLFRKDTGYIPDEEKDDFYESQRQAAMALKAKEEEAAKSSKPVYVEAHMPIISKQQPIGGQGPIPAINYAGVSDKSPSKILTMKTADAGMTATGAAELARQPTLSATPVTLAAAQDPNFYSSSPEVRRQTTQKYAAPEEKKPEIAKKLDMGGESPNKTQVDKEAEKLAAMKELMKKGNVIVPKRANTLAKKQDSDDDMNDDSDEAPVRSKSYGVPAAGYSGAGFVNYDAPQRQGTLPQPASFMTAQVGQVDYNQKSNGPGLSLTSAAGSTPAPIQSRQIFQAGDLGIGGGGASSSIELPPIGRR